MNHFALHRRWLLHTGLVWPFAVSGQDKAVVALPKRRLEFPLDGGAHLDFSNEWWYLTGYANDSAGVATYGFQVTFFRRRVPSTQALKSNFAAKQLLIAHAAVTDIAGQRLWHDQRIARWSARPMSPASVDSAWADVNQTHIVLDRWSLKEAGSQLQVQLLANHFALHLRLTAQQGRLLQGDEGLSRKGPLPHQASYYYSRPQLQINGTLRLNQASLQLGLGSTGWLDHEWSNAFLDAPAVGWDWIGINMLNGSALTAFQLRNASAAATWRGGSLRQNGLLRVFQPSDVVFTPVRFWYSEKTQTRYPVEWRVRTLEQTYTVRALVDNQELDSTATTGAIYWEGLCEVWNRDAQMVGRGYLEMTGYTTALKL